MNKTFFPLLYLLVSLPIYAQYADYDKPEHWKLIHTDESKGFRMYGNSFIRLNTENRMMIEGRHHQAKPLKYSGKFYTKSRFIYRIDCQNKTGTVEEFFFLDNEGNILEHSLVDTLPVDMMQTPLSKKLLEFTCM
ncbi:hypothetical protein [Neisseria sicca]|jgi:hypothetical protein|uniref:hypothetical protein n=1 Tax=Neisseria sicca TaxID=490 RepID=UPI000D315F84|nr:hypothetical protein [Neisseria sicca]MBF1285459.1 hypothetical protein [Neisseria sp.]